MLSSLFKLTFGLLSYFPGKDENYQKLSSDVLAMGGQDGRFGLELSGDLRSGDCNSDIDTFHTIQLSSDKNFDVSFILFHEFT